MFAEIRQRVIEKRLAANEAGPKKGPAPKGGSDDDDEGSREALRVRNKRCARASRRSHRVGAVRRCRAGLQDPNRPVGKFIFLGPTGLIT